jgi:hypothetical protein
MYACPCCGVQFAADAVGERLASVAEPPASAVGPAVRTAIAAATSSNGLAAVAAHVPTLVC